MKEESCGGDAVACDNCSVYSQAEGDYLCSCRDSRIHSVDRVAPRSERLLVCEACEGAPAAFLCKADAALLCTTCDADIHSANSLARRHHRVPISGPLYPPPGTTKTQFVTQETEDDDEEDAASWLLLNPAKTTTTPTTVPTTTTNNNNHCNGIDNGVLFNDGEGEEYFNIFEYNSGGDSQFIEQYNHDDQKKQKSYSAALQTTTYGGDSVVPVVQCREAKDYLQQPQLNFHLGFEYDPSKCYSFNGSISPSVPISLDVGVVPESTISDNSLSYTIPPKGTIDLFAAPTVQIPQQLNPTDREARILRYREKKKTRKFEKTIRYASRKAYAETRARIKGRFVKRTADADIEVDQMMFSTTLMNESGYGIVPSF